MKHKILAYAFLPAALSLGIAGATAASAGWFGGIGNATPDEIAARQTSMFEREAQLLGIDVGKIKDGWARGLTMQQLMQENNITQDQVQSRMKDLRLKELKTQLDALVAKGVITQSQADQRYQVVQNQAQNGKGQMNKRFFRGLHF